MKLYPKMSQILIEMLPVEIKSAGGVIINSENEQKREKGGRDIGYLRDVSPLAWCGVAGCTDETVDGRMKQAGISIGDLVEYKRYDGKTPRIAETHKEFDLYRLIMDTDILCVIKEDI